MSRFKEVVKRAQMEVVRAMREQVGYQEKPGPDGACCRNCRFGEGFPLEDEKKVEGDGYCRVSDPYEKSDVYRVPAAAYCELWKESRREQLQSDMEKEEMPETVKKG